MDSTKIQTYENLTVDRDKHIAVVTFNRPEKANALDHAHLTDIEAVALSFRDDADVRVVIFTGAGTHFSSGADLSPKPDPQSGNSGMVLTRRRARMGERAIQAIYEMDQITIAAWNGAAMGGGACLTTAMDFRIGADDCFMQYPEILIGVNLMWKSLPLITHLAGPANAKRLVVGGERVYSSQLLEWGLINEIVPRSELMNKTIEWANRYANLSPIPAQMIKQSINHIVSAMDSAVMHMDVDQNILSSSTADREVAVQAYLNKEQPNFSGN